MALIIWVLEFWFIPVIKSPSRLANCYREPEVTPGRSGSRAFAPPDSDKKESLRSCTSRNNAHKSARARAPARPACPTLLAAAFNICLKISSF